MVKYVSGNEMRTLKTQVEFSRFVADQVKQSGFTREKLAEKIGKDIRSIQQALAPSNEGNAGRNGTRLALLEALGVSVTRAWLIGSNGGSAMTKIAVQPTRYERKTGEAIYRCRDCGREERRPFGILPDGWQITPEGEFQCKLCVRFK